MQGEYYAVNSTSTLLTAQNALAVAFAEHKYLEMQMSAGKHRTLDQNRLIYRLYALGAKTREGERPQTVRQYCKLHFGVPLLRSEDVGFREKWDRCIKNNLTYEQKLEVMDWFPVSSLMNTEQETRFIDQILIEYNLEMPSV